MNHQNTNITQWRRADDSSQQEQRSRQGGAGPSRDRSLAPALALGAAQHVGMQVHTRVRGQRGRLPGKGDTQTQTQTQREGEGGREGEREGEGGRGREGGRRREREGGRRGGRGRERMDGWMDGCTALVPVRYIVCPGPVAFAVFPRLITAFPPHPLPGTRTHSFFHASTYWLIVCACALLSPLFSPLPPFTLSFSLVAPWCGAPHSCLRILEVSLGSSLATCRTVRLGHLHTVNRLLHCMGPFCRLGPPG